MSIINSISAQDGLKTIEEVVQGSNKSFNYGAFQRLVLLLTICIENVRQYRCTLPLMKDWVSSKQLNIISKAQLSLEIA